MDDAVNAGAEQTDLETSQVSEEESTDDELDSEDLSSGEDVNAQSEDDGEDLVGQAMGEVKAEKSRNRVQTLANENKSLRQELELQRQQQLQQSYQQQPQSQGDYLVAEMARLRFEQQQNNEKLLWNDAMRQDPMLDQESEDYSPEFENIVYSNYLTRKQNGEVNITPSQVAKEQRTFIEKFAGKATAKADVVREVKRTVTPLGGQRKPSDGEYSKYAAQKAKFQKTGNLDDLAELL